VLFQYAAGRKAALMHGIALKFDLLRTRGSGQIGPRKFATHDQLRNLCECYDLVWQPASAGEIAHVVGLPEWVRGIPKLGPRLFRHLARKAGYFVPCRTYELDERFFTLKPPFFLDSYYINPRYFADIDSVIRTDLRCRLPLPAAARRFEHDIQNSTSISIHVRRGDYLDPVKTRNIYPVYGSEYFRAAISRIQERTGPGRCFVFSDDIEWASRNILTRIDAIHVSLGAEQPWVDLELMRRCRHNVICNSTFSWWAAYLNENPDKIVVTPRKWRNDGMNADDMILKGWIPI
jgi:hypothetical protein